VPTSSRSRSSIRPWRSRHNNQTVGNYTRDNAASHPTKSDYSATPLSEWHIWHTTANGMQCPSVHPSTMLCFLVRKVLTTTAICIGKTTTGKFMIQ